MPEKLSKKTSYDVFSVEIIRKLWYYEIIGRDGNMIRIAIVDDQSEAISIILPIIKECQADLSVEFEIDTYTDTEVFQNALQTKVYQALFLDLEMPGRTGFDISSYLRENANDIPIVYITNRDDLMQKAFQYKALGFVRKDRIDDELPFALSCVVREIRLKMNNIVVITSQRHKKERYDLIISDILYIESGHHQTSIYVSGYKEAIVTRESLNYYANQSGFEKFIYISSSCIVNCDHIFSIESDTLILDNEMVLYISRRKIKTVKELFMQNSRRLII